MKLPSFNVLWFFFHFILNRLRSALTSNHRNGVMKNVFIGRLASRVHDYPHHTSSCYDSIVLSMLHRLHCTRQRIGPAEVRCHRFERSVPLLLYTHTNNFFCVQNI